MSMRYSILGAGAMGSVFGARLHLAGFDVELLNRSKQHSEAIKSNGLEATIDGYKHTIDISACTVEKARIADVVILFTKTHQIEMALHNMPSTLQNASVVTLQNGLGNGEKVAKQVGDSMTIEGVSMMPAEFIAPGKIESSDAANTWLSSRLNKNQKLAEQICADFNVAGITTTIEQDIDRLIWQKALFNIGMNALCGLTVASPGLLNKLPEARLLAHEIVDEAMEVAKVKKIKIDQSKVHEMIDFACNNHVKHKPSMLQDLERGRRTEIESLNGYIVNLADKLQVDVPLNRMLNTMVRIKQESSKFWSQ